MNKPHKPGRPYRCAPCGVAAGARNAMGLHNHEPEVMRPWAMGLAQAAMRAMAECDEREAGILTGPVPDDTRQLGYANRSRPRMRRNRAVREAVKAGGQ